MIYEERAVLKWIVDFVRAYPIVLTPIILPLGLYLGFLAFSYNGNVGMMVFIALIGGTMILVRSGNGKGRF